MNIDEVKVGDGATICYATDRYPATVCRVIPYKTGPNKGKVRVVLTRDDKAERVDRGGMTDQQVWRFEEDPEGFMRRFVRTKGGRLTYGGVQLALGFRDRFHDYTL